MATVERRTAQTHEVFNQPAPLGDYNSFEADRPLREAVRREGAEWAEERIAAVGALAGSVRARELGALANENPPRLRTHDRFGHRVDEVEFHPAWDELMRSGGRARTALRPLEGPAPRRPCGPRRRFRLHGAGRGGGRLPDLDDLLGDSGAAQPARPRRGVGAPLPLRLDYDRAQPLPPRAKPGALAGMAMTEKQGGTDVRANTTSARR